jgi:hypothetical protein
MGPEGDFGMAEYNTRAPRGAPWSFIEDAVICTDDCCLIWPYSINARFGYGQANGRQAHRIVCELAHGDPPSDAYQAAHSCGVRACVNPRHLRWATRSENSQDKVEHGTDALGEKSPKAKLWEEAVLDIRYSDEPGKDLARKYRISTTLVSLIRTGKRWEWVR